MSTIWKSLASILEAMESDNDRRPKMQKMPPAMPGAKNSPPRSFLPGVHDPSSDQRPGRRPQNEDDVDEAKPNWNRVQQQRNMQRWGSEDRRTKDDPLALYRKNKDAVDQSGQPISMRPRQGGLSDIPMGQDTSSPHQNPLMSPTSARTSPSRPRQGWEDLLDIDPNDVEG